MHAHDTGRGLVLSPRWHEGRLWFAGCTAGEIRALTEGGGSRRPHEAMNPPMARARPAALDRYVAWIPAVDEPPADPVRVFAVRAPARVLGQR